MNPSEQAVQKGMFIYSFSFEDSRVDDVVYDLKEQDLRIAMITTGGDNVINALLNKPQLVHAIDTNPHQNFLLEMKLAMLKKMSRQQTMACYNREAVPHLDALRAELSPGAALWWEAHNASVWNDFALAGTSGPAVTFVRWFYWCLGLSHEMLSDDELQNEYYAKNKWKYMIMSYFFWCALLWLGPLIGVPKAQFEHITKEYGGSEYGGSTYAWHALRSFLTSTSMRTNWIYRYYLGLSLNDDACPDYMSSDEAYDLARKMAHRVNISTGKMQDELDGDGKKYDRINVLDAMDWMTDVEMGNFVNKLVPCGGKLCFRTARSVCPAFLHTLKPKFERIDKTGVTKPYDRMGTYNAVCTADLSEGPVFVASVTPKYDQTLLTRFLVFLRMMIHPLIGNAGLDGFYEKQADDYDGYRVNMLHGKDRLMKALPMSPDKSHVLLYGGGTGDLLDYMEHSKPKDVVVLDLCSSLAQKATERIEDRGWGDRATVIVGDATKHDGQYDVVIATYALTMMPDWKAAIDNAFDCCRPGGVVAVADFTTDSAFWSWALAKDGVFPDSIHKEYLAKKGDVIHFEEFTGGFPFVPLLKCGHYAMIVQKGLDTPS